MNCLKCGKETAGLRIFCDDCAANMEQYPVKPGTPLHLPQRQPLQDRRSARKTSTMKETIASLHGMIRWLTATIAILTLIICILTSMLIRNISQQSDSNLIGKNYTTTTDVTGQP